MQSQLNRNLADAPAFAPINSNSIERLPIFIDDGSAALMNASTSNAPEDANAHEILVSVETESMNAGKSPFYLNSIRILFEHALDAQKRLHFAYLFPRNELTFERINRFGRFWNRWENYFLNEISHQKSDVLD